MKSSEATFPFNFMPSTFAPSSAFRDAMRQTVTNFWNGQDQILDAMEEYTNDWFERRHTGAHEALDSAQQMIEASTPVEAMHEYQKWVIGCLERTVSDGLACQKHLLSVSALLAPPLSPSGERSEAESAGETRRRSQSRVAA
jgi:hypothetical protein